MTKWPTRTLAAALLSVHLFAAGPGKADPNSADPQPDLAEVQVTALRVTNEATKLGVGIRDLPQNIATIDAATLQSNAVSSIEDFGHLNASLQPIQPYAGVISGGYNSRGYNAAFIMDGLSVGNIGGGSFATFLPDLLSSAEVLNGPTAIVFGQGSPGGLVNLVTVKPQADLGWAAKAVYTTENQKIVSLDLTGNLLPGLDARVLIEGERSASYRDLVHSQRNYIAPQLHWQITDQLSWRFLYVYDDYAYTFDPGLFYTPQLFGLHLPTSLNLSEPYLGLTHEPESIYRSDLEFDFASKWAAFLLAQYFDLGYNNFADRIYPNGAPAGSLVPRGEDYDVVPALNYNQDLNVEAYVRGAASTWAVDHQLTFDVAYQRGRQSYYNDFGSIPSIDYLNPAYSSVPYLPRFLYNSQGSSSVGSRSVAWSDLLSVGDHLKLLLGVRHDAVFDRNYDAPKFEALDPNPANQLDQGHVSKQAGIIYRPIDALSLYVSYADAFQPNLGISADHSAFQPVKSINREVGFKAEFLDRKLSLSGALYRIVQDNSLVTDPSNPNFQINGGLNQSKGFELQANYVSNTDARFGLGLGHTSTEYLNSLYVPYGDQIPSVPKWTVVASGDYRIAQGLFNSLRVFGNANYNSAAQSYLPNSQGAPIASYVRLDVGASYPVKQLLLQLNLKNSLNQRILLSNGANNEFPEAPRTLWITASWRSGSLR